MLLYMFLFTNGLYVIYFSSIILFFHQQKYYHYHHAHDVITLLFPQKVRIVYDSLMFDMLFYFITTLIALQGYHESDTDKLGLPIVPMTKR